MKKVVNDYVAMDWEHAGFLETKSNGFVAAVHEYDGIPVAFTEKSIYVMVDEDEDGELTPWDFKTLVTSIKKAVRGKDYAFPEDYEEYGELYDGVEFNEEFMEMLGLSGYLEDMEKRREDLSGYFYVVEENM